MGEPDRAVVLLSGGLDSATTLAVARDRGHDVHALSFQYGQRHGHELHAARRVARSFAVAEHLVVQIDPRLLAGSALTGDIEVPRDRSHEQIHGSIPVTYVPARNTLFLAHALSLAEALGAGHIYIGVNALDYSGYPDCRPEFIEAFQRLTRLATKAGVEAGDDEAIRIHAPLIEMTKARIIRLGVSLGVDYAMTSSCYCPDDQGAACGRCDSCRLRLKGFEDAGIPDPAVYTQHNRSDVGGST